MKTKILITLLILTLSTFSAIFAQSSAGTTWGYGINLGAARGDNAGADEVWVPAGRAYFQLGVSKLFLTQFGLSYVPIKTNPDNPDTYKDYETQILTGDIRFLFSPVPLGALSPYLYAGIGAAKDLKDTNSAFCPVFPFGLGLQVRAGRLVSFDLHGGYTLSSDKLDGRKRLDGDWNRLVASRYDGFYTMMAGISVNSPFGKKEIDRETIIEDTEPSINTKSDSDGDGLTDELEVSQYKTDPYKSDTDGDGLSDYDEVTIYNTYPLKIDSDNGGMNDGAEVKAGKNPLLEDDDIAETKIIDNTETIVQNNEIEQVDTDKDGLMDSEENSKYRTDPLKMDTDGDGLSDGDEVIKHHTDPLKEDTDQDGLSDSQEVSILKTNPNQADTDNDGLNDYAEVNTYRSNPSNIDTDGGGMNDGAEIQAKKNLLDPNDDLYDLKKDTKLVLIGINFATASLQILPNSEKVLQKVYDSLELNPDVSILISGHTDSVGSDADNESLSLRRASAVQNWLVDAGISSSRIQVVGKGESEPIATNDTLDGRAQNRRIEISVLNQ